MNWNPNKCVIYCGVHDLLDDENTLSIFDKLESLIFALRNENEDI